MLILFLYCFMPDKVVPMKVNIGDPVIEAKVVSLETKESFNLDDVIDEGFCFFFSASCNYCDAAYGNVSDLFEKYYTIILFVGEEESVRDFLRRHQGRSDNVYLVDAKYLEKYDIITYPGVVTYKNGKCRTAMHGPMDPVSIARLIQLYEKKKKS